MEYVYYENNKNIFKSTKIILPFGRKAIYKTADPSGTLTTITLAFQDAEVSHLQGI